jgi:hypothetical protein
LCEESANRWKRNRCEYIPDERWCSWFPFSLSCIVVVACRIRRKDREVLLKKKKKKKKEKKKEKEKLSQEICNRIKEEGKGSPENGILIELAQRVIMSNIYFFQVELHIDSTVVGSLV